MKRTKIAQFVTPRDETMLLRSSVIIARTEVVRRGVPLRVTGWHDNDQVQVEYLGEHWLAVSTRLQSWHEAVGGDRKGAVPFREDAQRSVIEMRRHRRLIVAGLTLAIILAAGLIIWRLDPSQEGSSSTWEARPHGEQSLGPLTTSEQRSRPAASSTPATRAQATSPASQSLTPVLPSVSGLLVCDTTSACGTDGSIDRRTIMAACLHMTAAGDAGPANCKSWLRVPESGPLPRIVACLSVLPGGDGAPVRLIATAPRELPADAHLSAAVARSGPIPQDPERRCFTVQSAGSELPPGDYWLWVLHGSTPIARLPFPLAPLP